jgi:hypothetical protein
MEDKSERVTTAVQQHGRNGNDRWASQCYAMASSIYEGGALRLRLGLRATNILWYCAKYTVI